MEGLAITKARGMKNNPRASARNSNPELVDRTKNLQSKPMTAASVPALKKFQPNRSGGGKEENKFINTETKTRARGPRSQALPIQNPPMALTAMKARSPLIQAARR